METVTPMLRQYLEIKRSYPGTILFFRLGDFYEMFNEDAIVGARELQITLTARQKESPNPIPMCGVPHHAAAGYISKLVNKGYRVAICEQAEPSIKGIKLVKREVVRVISPGTAIDEQLSGKAESNFLAALSCSVDTVGAAFLDISTGDFFATESSGNDAWQTIQSHVDRHSPRELLVNESHKRDVRNLLQLSGEGSGLFEPHTSAQGTSGNPTLTVLDGTRIEGRDAEQILCDHFGVAEMSGFGIAFAKEAMIAAATCLKYVYETQKNAAAHITSISFFETSDSMILDGVTLSNLEVVKARNEARGKTLLSVIDETVTGMGSRLLKAWLLRPLLKRSEIQTRLSAVAELIDPVLRDKVRFLLKGVSDIERLTAKLNLGSMMPKDLLALNSSLEQVPRMSEMLVDSRSLLIQVLAENLFNLPEIKTLIESSIAEDPPVQLSDGGYIRRGFNGELDRLRDLSDSVKVTIAAFENAERERTGIPTLKVRFNNVFGYYIEISKAQLSKAPADYERRQTLANAERYTTPQLKEWESDVLGADEKVSALEAELYKEIISSVRAETLKLQSTAKAIATIDALASLAEIAAKRNYAAPILHEGDEIEIIKGRHPVVESTMPDAFVPNDTYLNNSTDRLLIVTGANMGGKSTILRQVALIQILAQIGSFVPASSAKLPLVDRIWTRVGASDDLASGRSTFMVEMTETAAILHNSTPRSLILLDEIGRGTSTFDGLSIAWAVAEYLHNSTEHSAKTVFATHYHELTELAEILPGAKNYQMAARETDGDVVFLHKLEKGKASKSYGIAVAKLAGLPVKVIRRAQEVLAKLEEYELAVFSSEKQTGIAAAAGRSGAAQFSLFAIANENLVNDLRAADLTSLTPEECKSLLLDLKARII